MHNHIVSYGAQCNVCVRVVCLGWLVGGGLFEAKPLSQDLKKEEVTAIRRGNKGKELRDRDRDSIYGSLRLYLSLNETDEQLPKSGTRKQTPGAA